MKKPRREKLPANVSSFVDRHGKLRYRFRKTGFPTRYFQAHPNSDEGKAELAAMLRRQPVAADRHQHGTIGWLMPRYLTSLDFTGRKNAATERNSRRILAPFFEQFADDRVADFRFDHIESILARAAKPRVENGRKRGGPSAANNLRGELKPLFDYAFKLLGIAKPNPVDQAASITVPKGGFHSWTEDEIAQYRKRHPLGTQARLAAEIVLWTWQRRGDASQFGRKHMRDGKFQFAQSKTGKTLWLPVAPQLQAAIDAMAVTGTETFLVTHYGKPFTTAGLGNRMREWCNQAGLPHCSMHGLRKAGARRAANLGASNQMLKAVGGWVGDKEVATYTADADQARLAELTLAAMIDFDKG